MPKTSQIKNTQKVLTNSNEKPKRISSVDHPNKLVKLTFANKCKTPI